MITDEMSRIRSRILIRIRIRIRTKMIRNTAFYLSYLSFTGIVSRYKNRVQWFVAGFAWIRFSLIRAQDPIQSFAFNREEPLCLVTEGLGAVNYYLIFFQVH
jgi:hypothetical protein